MGISRYLNRLSVQPFKPRYFAAQTWVETIQGSGSTFRSWSVGQDCRQGAHSLDIFGSVITVMKHWEMASWLQGETPKCQWWQEDEFLSRVVRSMGSHLSHDRAKELGMMEVPDMATVPWKVNDIVFWIAGIWGFWGKWMKSHILPHIHHILTKQWDQFDLDLAWSRCVGDLCEHWKTAWLRSCGNSWRILERRPLYPLYPTNVNGWREKKGSFVGAIVVGNSNAAPLLLSPVWVLSEALEQSPSWALDPRASPRDFEAGMFTDVHRNQVTISHYLCRCF